MIPAFTNQVQVPAGSIVVGVDGSGPSETALEWAAEQAALEQRPLAIVHSLRPGSLPGTGGMYATTGVDYGAIVDDIHEGGRALLATATKQARAKFPDLVVHSVLDYCDPRILLLDLAENATMVVVGSRGRGPVSSLLLGSVSVAVSKHAACPVVVLRPATGGPLAGVLVGVDGSERSQPAIEFAYRMASWRTLPLTVLHSFWQEPSGDRAATGLETGAATRAGTSEQALIAESLAGMREKFPEVSAEVRLTLGFAAQQLIEASDSYDLLVIGHRPVKVLDDLVHGTVAPTVVEHAHCPVAVVPSPLSDAGSRGR